MRKLISLSFVLMAVIFLSGCNRQPTSKDNQESADTRGQGSEANGSSNNEQNSEKQTLFEGWEKYSHNVLGLEFIYPKKWGEPVGGLGSAEYITNLSIINNTNYFGIGFKDGGPLVGIYNDKYAGEMYPNTQTYYLGAIDNFKELTVTGDICKYKIEFNNNPTNTGTIYEKYSECAQDVKAAFLEDKKFFGRSVYEYTLKLYGFKKLQNGFFNNLLATDFFGASGQLDHQIELKDYFNLELMRGGEKIKVTEQEFEQEKNDFTQFVNSIKLFKPKSLPREEFKTVKNEDPNITIIRKYYYNISRGNLKEAYEMYWQKKVGYNTYQNWYINTIVASPHDFKKLAEGKYQFFVDLQDHNQAPKKYRTIMQIREGKVNTLVSEEITSEFVKFGNVSAFTKNRLGYNYLILKKNNQEVEVDKATDDYNKSIHDTLYFISPKFSPLGNFLTYSAYGWEWSFGRVYDINKGKIVLDQSSLNEYGFSKDEKYFYGCGASAMAGDYFANIYSTENFKIKADILGVIENKFPWDINCEFNKAENKLKATITCFSDGTPDNNCKTEQVEYDFDNESLKVIK